MDNKNNKYFIQKYLNKMLVIILFSFEKINVIQKFSNNFIQF